MLKLSNISRSFSGVRAVNDMSIEFKAGEVHALCGENGAGKSTLMNIIAGNLQQDEGQLYWNGNKIKDHNIRQAQNLGISIVYQEKSLVDPLSVAENIYPDNQPHSRFGIVNFEALYRQTQQLLDQLQLNEILPKALVKKLSAPQKQMVEIAKALAVQPKLIIFDEPTASITHKETATLFAIIRQLKAKGVAVIYISHRMDEILNIADVVSVMKDGVYQGMVKVGSTTTDEIVKMMVGRNMPNDRHESNSTKATHLEVQGISGKGFSQVSFSLHKGEVLGFAGLPGAGRTEMAMAIFGAMKISTGKVFKDGEEMRFDHPSDAIKHRIAYIPDERKLSGLFLDRTVAENTTVVKLQESNWYNEAENISDTLVYVKRLGIRTPSVKQTVKKLSGGNQQKVVLAKWLSIDPDIIIINEPTNGVDIGAKFDIYQILRELTKEGKSILLISSELSELLLLSDRVAVMYNGQISDILDRREATEENIATLASGSKTKL